MLLTPNHQYFRHILALDAARLEIRTNLSKGNPPNEVRAEGWSSPGQVSENFRDRPLQSSFGTFAAKSTKRRKKND